MKEIWKSAKGYEGLYEVSNLGRVKGIKRIVKNGKDRTMIKPEKILSPINNGNGYYFVNLLKDGKQSKMFIHRLVAMTFLPNTEKYKVVNHKDEDPSNNDVDNLEWCTHKYNSNYGTSKERRVKSTDYKALGNSRKKIVVQYDLSGRIIKEWDSAVDCSNDIGYHTSGIYACCNGRWETYKGFKWEYKKEDAICS